MLDVVHQLPMKNIHEMPYSSASFSLEPTLKQYANWETSEASAPLSITRRCYVDSKCLSLVGTDMRAAKFHYHGVARYVLFQMPIESFDSPC